MKKILLTLSLSLASGLLSGMAQGAENTCEYPPGQGPKNMTIPLITTNITVGADVAVGDIIHRQKVDILESSRSWLRCAPHDEAVPFYVEQYLNLINTPALIPGWTGRYAGSVYQTSVPGIGVALVNDDGDMLGNAINSTPLKKWSYEINKIYFAYVGNRFSLVFIKTGVISAGAIDGALLPTLILTAKGSVPVVGLPTVVYKENFSGRINVTSGTCKTPDVIVPMGSYDTSKYFNGQVTATPWRPFNILLTNCPSFYGTYTSEADPPLFNVGGDNNTGALSQNSFNLQVSPTFGANNAQLGIINLSNEENTASGIGIQLATGETTNPSPAPFNLNSSYVMNVKSSSPGTQLIPLQARYIQTGTTVTPGKANSKAMFTISYH